MFFSKKKTSEPRKIEQYERTIPLQKRRQRIARCEDFKGKVTVPVSSPTKDLAQPPPSFCYLPFRRSFRSSPLVSVVCLSMRGRVWLSSGWSTIRISSLFSAPQLDSSPIGSALKPLILNIVYENTKRMVALKGHIYYFIQKTTKSKGAQDHLTAVIGKSDADGNSGLNGSIFLNGTPTRRRHRQLLGLVKTDSSLGLLANNGVLLT